MFDRKLLGDNPEDYVKWLTLGSSSWGGVPELNALALHYETEFGVVVMSDQKIELFGADRGYTKRVYILFDGAHYNLIKSNEVRVFDPKDKLAYEGCLVLAKECKDKGEDLDTYNEYQNMV